jgi:RNA polymerase sigma-54 factor
MLAAWIPLTWRRWSPKFDAWTPKPGAQFEHEPLRPLIPDVLMRAMPVKTEGDSDWMLEINPETMPRLLIRRGFHARMAASASRETKSFLSEQMQGATWLVKALESRAHTILRVSAEIVRRQDGFFRMASAICGRSPCAISPPRWNCMKAR